MTYKNQTKPLIIAHRGASGLAHENTIEALKLAYQLKADGIEFDLRKTKDGIIVIHHNPNIDDYLICEHTYDELKVITSKKGYQIPQFTEVVTELAGKIFMDIEIKETGFEKEVIDLVLSHTSYNMFMIRSFKQEIIIKVKELDHNIKTALILGEKHLKYGIFSRVFDVFPKKHIKKTKCDIISPYHKLLLFSYIKRMHKLGIPVSVWTVNDEKLMRKLIRKNVDYIITNYPNKAIEILKEENI